MSHRRVVSDQIPGHEGLFGTTSPFGLGQTLARLLGGHLRLHLLPKLLEPLLSHLLFVPGRSRQKATHPGQTRRLAHLSQQLREHPSAFAQHQPHQYGHQVRVLRLTELLSEPFDKVAQRVIQAYNGNRHRTPPWLKGFLFTLVIPHGVLSCSLPLKSANIEVYVEPLNSGSNETICYR
jgi:hypothetical protein